MKSAFKKVGWDTQARQQLRALYLFIQKSLPQNAEKVRADIISVTDKLPFNPEIYSLDKYKDDNDGSFRAFEKNRYRVA